MPGVPLVCRGQLARMWAGRAPYGGNAGPSLHAYPLSYNLTEILAVPFPAPFRCLYNAPQSNRKAPPSDLEEPSKVLAYPHHFEGFKTPYSHLMLH